METKNTEIRNAITGVLCEWERNGYHDSDFYVARWDGEKVVTVEIGSTRYGGGCLAVVRASDEEILAARVWLAEVIFWCLREAEDRAVLEPDRVREGDEVRFLQAHKFFDKKTGTRVEALFSESGRVFWAGAFGRFYQNGYNRPGRHNTRVGIELTDGRRLFAPLEKLRLDRHPATDEVLRARAENQSWNGKFGGGAWDTWNHAADRLRELRPVPKI